ncbi:hypothetical protein [Tunturiibacter gelidiferens]|uniref:hypothetical protein n=1 Tax=Tunturiibacter gelidiferens TaxID=3069689 RepID=UPI003D9B7F9B
MMAKGKILKPKQDKGKRIALSASAESATDYSRETPTFCLRYVDPEYCVSLCEKDDKAAFADRVRKLSQVTWNEIIQADRHGFGREKIATSSLKRPIPRHLTEDVTFIALRFSGKKPMVGYQSGRTFHAIWFDRDMSGGVYPHS